MSGKGWISLTTEAVGCHDCGGETDYTLRLCNESGQHIGWLCEGCYADTVETPESLRARGEYLFSDGGA